jgi:hypothetical protein
MFRTHRYVNYNPKDISLCLVPHIQIIDNFGVSGEDSARNKERRTDETTTSQPSVHPPQGQHEADSAHEEVRPPETAPQAGQNQTLSLLTHPIPAR